MAAPVIGQAARLALISNKLVEEMFRVIAMGVAIRTSFLNKQFFVGTTVRIPELEGDRVHGAVIAILSIGKGPGCRRQICLVIRTKRRGYSLTQTNNHNQTRPKTGEY